MSTNARGTCDLKTWEETSYAETEGTPRLSRVSATQVFDGDIEGEGWVEFLMMYRNPESVSFIGIQRVVGQVNGRSGSFVLQSTGAYENQTAKGSWFVIPGSGTGDLRGLRGEGGFIALRGPRASITLDYDFENAPE